MEMMKHVPCFQQFENLMRYIVTNTNMVW